MRPSDALATHRAALRQLVSRYGLSRPRVFGSVATGTDDEESDLDLLVEPTEITTHLHAWGLAGRCRGIARHESIRSDAGGFAAQISGQGVGAGRPFMKHPERVEDYLEHMAEAAARAVEYQQRIGK